MEERTSNTVTAKQVLDELDGQRGLVRGLRVRTEELEQENTRLTKMLEEPSDEVVEAVAEAIYIANPSFLKAKWEIHKDNYQRDAKAAIKAYQEAMRDLSA